MHFLGSYFNAVMNKNLLIQYIVTLITKITSLLVILPLLFKENYMYTLLHVYTFIYQIHYKIHLSCKKVNFVMNLINKRGIIDLLLFTATSVVARFIFFFLFNCLSMPTDAITKYNGIN